MPLSKCPKCKGVVSTSVNKCINCGEPFKVCSNCQTAVSLNAEKCPSCGNEFIHNSAESLSDTTTEITTIDQVHNEWEEKVLPTMKKANALILIDKILRILSLVMMVPLIISALFKLEELFAVCVVVFVLPAAYSMGGRVLLSIASRMHLANIWQWSCDNGYDLCKMHREEINQLKQTCEISEYEKKHIEIRKKNETELSAVFLATPFADKKKKQFIFLSIARLVIGIAITCYSIFFFDIIINVDFNIRTKSDVLDVGKAMCLLIIGVVISSVLEFGAEFIDKSYKKSYDKLSGAVIDLIEIGEDIGISK